MEAGLDDINRVMEAGLDDNSRVMEAGLLDNRVMEAELEEPMYYTSTACSKNKLF